MVFQCQQLIHYLVSVKFPNIPVPRDWRGMIGCLQNHRPLLLHFPVKWEFPIQGWVKANTNRVCKGNPGPISYAFCLRNGDENPIYAEAGAMGFSTTLEAEAMAILRCLRYCKDREVTNILVDTDSLCLQHIINGVWACPWIIIEEIEEIRSYIHNI